MAEIRSFLGAEIGPALIEALEAAQRQGYEVVELEAGENMPIKLCTVENLGPETDMAVFVTVYWNGERWHRA